jgi:hypothetical protein
VTCHTVVVLAFQEGWFIAVVVSNGVEDCLLYMMFNINANLRTRLANLLMKHYMSDSKVVRRSCVILNGCCITIVGPWSEFFHR